MTLRRVLGDGTVDAVKNATGLTAWQRRSAAKRGAALEDAYNQKRIEFLSRHVPPGAVGAELGVFQGRFSPCLLMGLRPKRLHLIDPWFHLTPEWHWGEGSRSTVDALIEILKQQKSAIASGRVMVHLGDDLAVLRGFPDASLDWAYVDSSHAYQHTVDELELLLNKVKPGGLVTGDDWRPDPNHRHHGVYRAVQEAVARDAYEFVAADEAIRQWALRRVGGEGGI
ncbi:class I SAM-dependent methyltransferase [Botrimarina sp.]|uniref:class I SAM-dependent methyltransferase n=1 Tax=Botrimarina sp. TaxID=2795802 RepID=UPI0032ED2037